MHNFDAFKREPPSMSLSLVHSRALLGLEARPVCVEVHLANGLPSFTLVGLAETEVKEARERVRSAIQNTGLEFPANKRITVNPVSYTHLRAHETDSYLVCRLL